MSMEGRYEKKIDALLAQMTLEEKVGQLQQCGPSLVGAFEVSFEELLDMMFDGRISQEEFGRLMSTATQDYHEDDLRAGKIGSYNGVGDAATANRLQKIAVEESRLGIPLIFGYDVIHGFRTVTPIPLAESCAWEPELWERTARLAAQEATAAGIHMTFAPMVDPAKDARWGRVSEGAGEDALLNGLYGAAKVRGFQGDDLTKEDAMVACVKHFAAYGAGEAGRDYNRVDMSMQRLYEEYLPAYQKCIEAGARAVMPAFNDINGVPCSVNGWLLRDVLRHDWGFDGMTVSDANAIAECVNHGIAADQRDAAKQALLAGMDMDMTSNSYIKYVGELVESGEVEMGVLDEAVRNILRLKFELGLFEHPYKTDEAREAEAFLKPEAVALAREAAVKSIVLLKNGDLQPAQCIQSDAGNEVGGAATQENVSPLPDQRDAAKQALLAGMDMDMTSNSYIKYVGELVESGEVEMGVLDEAVRNILRLKFELGLFEHPYKTDEAREAEAFLKPEAVALAREAAVKSIVLLKNGDLQPAQCIQSDAGNEVGGAATQENVSPLPLRRDAKLAIFGELAAADGEMTGAWSIGAHPEDCISLNRALEGRGIPFAYDATGEHIAKTVEDADVILAVLGEKKDQSGEAASRAEITLAEEELKLLRALKETGKPVVVILFNGRPLAIPEVAAEADAVLEAWHPGLQAGEALLDILYGDANPSAKLTTTFPAKTGQCPMYYAHINTGRPGGKSKFTSKYLDAPNEPVYPFGYGLSYTTFTYGDLRAEALDDGGIRAAVSVTNTGDRAGEEIVQCYIQDVVAKRVRPVMELKAFDKISLNPGETKTVEFEIPGKDLGYYDAQMNFCVDGGLYRVKVGTNSAKYLQADVILS